MEQRVRVNDGQGAQFRSVPIPHLQVSATTMGSADVLYTVQDSGILQIQQLCVANTSGTAAELSLHSVPRGGAAAVDNTEIPALSIPANTVVDLTTFVGGLYAAGTTLEAFAGTTDVLVVHGWAKEIL